MFFFSPQCCCWTRCWCLSQSPQCHEAWWEDTRLLVSRRTHTRVKGTAQRSCTADLTHGRKNLSKWKWMDGFEKWSRYRCCLHEPAFSQMANRGRLHNISGYIQYDTSFNDKSTHHWHPPSLRITSDLHQSMCVKTNQECNHTKQSSVCQIHSRGLVD